MADDEKPDIDGSNNGSRSRTRLVIIGTGIPYPDPLLSGPAAAIIVDDTPYLVDFGPGVIRRTEAAYLSGEYSLRSRNLKTAFLSHMHSDHTIGYPDLIYTPWVMGRDEPVQVYGPKGLDNMTAHMLAAYDMDKTQRICGLEAINPDGFGVVSHEIEAGRIYQDERIEVDAFLVDHGDTWEAFGFRFQTPDGVIVISGDTRPAEGLIEASKGCDILLHEVYSAAGFRNRPQDWQRYHSHMHTSSEELAEIASEIQPGMLVLTHLLLWGRSEEELLEEVSEGYAGDVVCASDLDIFQLEKDGEGWYSNLLLPERFQK